MNAMKRLLMLAALFLALMPAGFAQHHAMSPGGAPAPETPEPPKGGEEIHWMNIDEVQVAMKKQPKKVWIDVYTDWCGWCKRMDKTTFANPDLVKYMNEHFYAVKLDAEQKSDIRFMGKMYSFVPDQRANAFATEILHGQMSYPTGVFMEENFQTPQLIPGYHDVKEMEMILKYLGEGLYRKTPFPEYQAAFKPSWVKE
jgi:thioredoxin-related protein